MSKLPWDWYWEAKLTCRGKTLWGTLNSLRRKGLRSWHSCKCVPSQLLYTDRAAFWSARKPSSLLNHSTLRDRMWGSNLPSVCCSLPWDSESGSVPASLSPTKTPGVWAAPRRETWNISSAILSLGTAHCLHGKRRIQFLLAPGICLWRTWDNDGVLEKKRKDNVLFVNGT